MKILSLNVCCFSSLIFEQEEATNLESEIEELDVDEDDGTIEMRYVNPKLFDFVFTSFTF